MKSAFYAGFLLLGLTAILAAPNPGELSAMADQESTNAISSSEFLLDAYPVASHQRSAPDTDRLRIDLPVATPLTVVYAGGQRLGHDLQRGLARPTALASGDFDEDGVVDLISGHAAPDGGVVAFHRGNVDALYPESGIGSDAPFLSPAIPFAFPGRPDFLGAGDFDCDGHADLIAATRGGALLYFLPGDGRGGFGAAERVTLPGNLTAMVTGEIRRVDALPDLVVAVIGSEGPALMVYQGPDGALRSEPEILALPAAATAIALGRIDGDPFVDLAIGAGADLLFASGLAGPLEIVPLGLDSIDGSSAITSVAWGDFVWEPVPQPELALLLENGTVSILGDPDAEGRWKSIAERSLVTPNATPAAGSGLFPVRVSGLPTDDLLVIDAAGREMKLLAGMISGDAAEAPGVVVSASLDLQTVAVLPMRLNADALTDLILLDDSGSIAMSATATAATIVVDSPVDSAVPGDAQCTLREAITNANANLDTTAGDCAAGTGADSIIFNIGGGGATARLTLVSALPPISDSVTLDGNTQACPSPPCIYLDGRVTVGADGLILSAGSSTVRGLVIAEFDGRGMVIESIGNFIEGNYVGIDPSGSSAIPNGSFGMFIISADNVIGGTVPAARNVVSGNLGAGIRLDGILATGNQVLGNFVGTDVTGTVDLGNTLAGVALVTDTSGNTVGGAVPGARNLVSGNQSFGVAVVWGSRGNQVLGNYIGTDISGTADLGNTDDGILVEDAPDNTIGGTAPGAGNLISGNDNMGIELLYPATTGTQVLGNFIGTDVTGTVDLGNSTRGIRIDGGPSGNVVGGLAAGARNLISGNDTFGVVIIAGATGNEVLGNFIGTDVTGTVDLGNGSSGVLIQEAPSNTVGGEDPAAGNLVSGNDYVGVYILGQSSTGNQVLGNLIGTDVTGTVDLGNTSYGVFINNGSSNNVLGGPAAGARNLISGNDSFGVVIYTGATGNEVLGNLIGTDVTGTVDLGNALSGVLIQEAPANTVGGQHAAAGNLISGNAGAGVYILGQSSTGNQVLGNRIGTDISGTLGLGNGGSGVRIQDAPSNTVGGTIEGAGNLISANAGDGVFIITILSSGNQVLGNRIGTDISGTVDLGNLLAGVEIQDGPDNTIGGNLISGNDQMGVLVELAALGNLVQGNLIGTDISGTSDLGNGYSGVQVSSGATNTTIGGPAPEDANVIAFNVDEGVLVRDDSYGNAVLGNSIVDNGLIGIDLGNSDGVTPNDPTDPDAGPNGLQNYPMLTRADATPSPAVTVDGTLDSTPNTVFRIEFFASTDCDPSGCGEGERFLGVASATTDGGGNATFSLLLPAAVSNGEAITATATDTANNTSEFADCFAAACSGLASFGHMIVLPNRNFVAWPVPSDIRFVKGDLAGVSGYSTMAAGWMMATDALDIASDNPAPGDGLYYVIKPLGCGSWQTSPAAEPGRDVGLP